DPIEYGKDYDWNKPFFEQFKELLFSVPHISILNANTVNSDWVNQETDDKNCYLNVGGHFNEDSAYNTYELYGKDCFDNFLILQCELCYENIFCKRCYKTLFSQNCFDCLDTIFSYDCRNCQNIFGCAGLRHKQYYIFNKPYSKEDYQEFFKKNSLTFHKNFFSLKEKARKIWLSVPYRDTLIVKSVNSWGNFIDESKNAKNCWNGEKIEDSKYLFITGWIKDSYDCSCVAFTELSYEIASSTGFYNSKFCLFNLTGGAPGKMSCFNLEYCYGVVGSNNCFGCVNLKNKEYCILNKQYSKEEYEELVPKIIEHMNEMPYISKIQNAKVSTYGRSTAGGKNQNKEKIKTKEIVYQYGEFFPIEFSLFGYNETAAQDYYPLNKKEALEKGYSWSDYESDIKYDFSDYQIPDDISEVKDDILDKILKCEITGRAYKIIPMELEFYRRMRLPIPKKFPLQRHKERILQLPPRKLFQRQCQKCQKEIQTVYDLDRPEIVYCEKCYLAEVV
ncbi:MAG: hypothetical protein AAB526_01945, partial [Patescibacteria group bacterium]